MKCLCRQLNGKGGEGEGYSTEDSAISSDHFSRHPSSDSLTTTEPSKTSGSAHFIPSKPRSFKPSTKFFSYFHRFLSFFFRFFLLKALKRYHLQKKKNVAYWFYFDSLVPTAIVHCPTTNFNLFHSN